MSDSRNDLIPQQRAELAAGAVASPLEPQYFVGQGTGGGGFNLSDILGTLRRNVWLIVCVVTVAVGVAAYFVSREVTVYTANGTVRIMNRSLVVGGNVVTAAPIGRTDPMLSEILILTGRMVVGEAVEEQGLRLFTTQPYTPTGLAKDVRITLPADQTGLIRLRFEEDKVVYGPEGDRRSADYGQPIAFEGASFVIPKRPDRTDVTLSVVSKGVAVDNVIASLEASPMPATGAIDVSYTSLDPEVGARVVNGVIEAYQEMNAENARENVRRRREFLEEQIKTTDSLLLAAQSKLSGMRSSQQAYSARDKFMSAQGELMSVEIQQAQLQAELRMYEGALERIRTAEGEGGSLDALMSLPGIGNAPIVSHLYAQLVGYRSEREGMLAGPWARAESHPDVQRLNTLIAATERQLLQAVDNHIASIRAEIASLGGLRGRALSQMGSLPAAEVQEVFLSQNLSALQMMGDQLRDQYQSVRLEEAGVTGQVEIVQLASSAYPVRPTPTLKLLLGVLTGLMIGVGLAFLREKIDPSITRAEDIEEMLLVPNLAVIPRAAPYLLEAGSGANGNSGAPHAIDPPGAEAYRVLRTNLLFSQGNLKSLVVTSAAPGEGKTMTALNLAAACARQGMHTLLMECDLRRPSLKRYFDTDEGRDLSSVLFENRPWDAAIQKTKMPQLDVLLAGKYFPRAAEFLSGAEMSQLLKELSARYDMVILDTSPLLVAADATVLGAIVDGVLLVVRASETNRGAVQQAVHQLTLVGANIVGTVLNDPEGAVSRYDSGYYDYTPEYELR